MVGLRIEWDDYSNKNKLICKDDLFDELNGQEEGAKETVSFIYRYYNSIGYELPKGEPVAVIKDWAKTSDCELYYVLKLDNDKQAPITIHYNEYNYPELTFWGFKTTHNGPIYGLWRLPGAVSYLAKPYLEDIINHQD